MSPFNTSKYRSTNQPGQPIRPLRDAFSRYGGRISSKRLARKIDRTPLSRTQREYVKQVMAKYDKFGSIGVTRKEFKEGLHEMEINTRDSIKKKELENIKKHFR